MRFLKMDESMGNSHETQLPTPNKKYTNLKNMGLFNKYVWLWIHVYVLDLGRLKIMMVCALRTFSGKAGFGKIPVSVISQSSMIAFGSRSTYDHHSTYQGIKTLSQTSCFWVGRHVYTWQTWNSISPSWNGMKIEANFFF